MESNTNVEITTETWSLKKLAEKKDKIVKSQFQRNSNWSLHPNPKNEKKSNIRDYIIFLSNIGHSVLPISLGEYISNNEIRYSVIDGNNRINAIITFLDHPLKVFPDLKLALFDVLDEIMNNKEEDKETIQELKEQIHNLNYEKISTFRRVSDILTFPESLDLKAK